MAFVLGFCPKLCWQLGKEKLSYVDASYAGIGKKRKNPLSLDYHQFLRLIFEGDGRQ